MVDSGFCRHHVCGQGILHFFGKANEFSVKRSGERAVFGEVVEFVGILGEIVGFGEFRLAFVVDEFGGFRADADAGRGVAEFFFVVGQEGLAPIGGLVAEGDFLETGAVHARVGGKAGKVEPCGGEVDVEHHVIVQFSFREQVEPVYRELVDLLLQPSQSSPSQGGAGEVSQANLQQARSTIEALQLAELANFFREACLDTQTQLIDRIDPTAAVIYPIILRDRLEVILSLPNQPLRNYSTKLSQEQVEEGINRMRQSLRRTSFAQERLSVANTIYSWLVEPAAADLTRQSIKTLVFVLDGSLRNLPMAALHDGKQYLIEQYRIAIAPSLQLFNSQPLARTQHKALLAGLSDGNQAFSALPGVKEEISEVSTTVRATILLDRQFTTQALQTQIKTRPFSIVHLATHGQFSSKPEETFILTWDGRLDVKQLNTLLGSRDLPNSPPLELLVLSACQTAKGDQRAALGLAGVAVRSGARSTLATLWTVNDESTAKFMEQFYKELFTPNITRAEAVRQAQLYLLKTPESKHPYFWAPFILVGNWL